MSTLQRKEISERISQQLLAAENQLRREWVDSEPINHFILDDLLPAEWADAIRTAFPAEKGMTLKRSLRELKYITAQMDQCDRVLEDVIYAFQSASVLQTVGRITGLAELEPDTLLYAGGISLMAPGHFLNPHVDNSHDRGRQRYRVLNLLYYVSRNWSLENGGNLELWPSGPKAQPSTLISKFNRLIVMVTHQRSWHSVSRNISSENRCCVSNYYFSKRPIGGRDYFHVTSFRGRPEQPVRDMLLRGDIWLRMAIRKVFPMGIKENRHFYKK